MKKKLYITFIVAFAALLSVSAYFLISDYVDEKKQSYSYNELAQIVDTPDDDIEPIQYTTEKTILPEYTELYMQNNDMVGWILNGLPSLFYV